MEITERVQLRTQLRVEALSQARNLLQGPGQGPGAVYEAAEMFYDFLVMDLNNTLN